MAVKTKKKEIRHIEYLYNMVKSYQLNIKIVINPLKKIS